MSTLADGFASKTLLLDPFYNTRFAKSTEEARSFDVLKNKKV